MASERRLTKTKVANAGEYSQMAKKRNMITPKLLIYLLSKVNNMILSIEKRELHR